MPVLLVTYAQNTPGKDYTPLYDAIKKNCSEWWHYLDHVWIVNSSQTADQLARNLYPYMTKLDSLLVVRITAEHQGWLPQDAWNWLNDKKY